MSIKQVMIYGSNGGIGSAIAKKFLQNDYNLFLFSRNETKLNQNLSQLKQMAPNLSVNGIPVDVCDSKSIEESFRYVKNKNRLPVSHLIVCQGVNKNTLLIKETDLNIDEIIQTNLISSLNICKEFFKTVISTPKSNSSIVLIGSVIGSVGNVGQTTYASSKSALVGLVRSLRKELSKKDVRVNLVLPGFIDTPMLDGLDKNKLIQNIPLNRLGRSDEVANAVYFLCTNKMMNGQEFVIDGGLSLVS